MASTSDKLGKVLSAQQSITEIVALSQKSAELHEEANIPMPPVLTAILNVLLGREPEPKTTKADARRPSRKPILAPFPPMKSGWVTVPVRGAMPQTLALVVLRNGTMHVQDVMTRVRAFGAAFTDGSMHNVGTRLRGAGVIAMTEDGWKLLDVDAAPTVKDGRLHGPKSVFQMLEIATYRREVIIAYMEAYGRLSRSVILSLLKSTDWLQAPVSVSLVKSDLLVLQDEGLIRRATTGAGSGWDWELTPKTKERKEKQLKLA